MKRWLPVASLLGAALVIGAAAWMWIGAGGPAASSPTATSARGVEAGTGVLPPPHDAPANVITAEMAETTGAEGEDASEPSPAEGARPLEAERAVERVAAVDVRGYILVSRPGGEPPPSEDGWVVLQSIAGSPARCRVAAPLRDGRFTAQLPGNAIVTAERVELEEQRALVAYETFDVAESTLLQIHVAWAKPTTLRVRDAASGVELRDVRLADAYGEPIGRERLQFRPDEPRELADSPLALSPPFDRRSFRFDWVERLRVGAPGHATEEVEVAYGQGDEFFVELGIAARLVVRLAPWPPPKIESASSEEDLPGIRVHLSRGQPAGTFVDGAGSFNHFEDDSIIVLSTDLGPSLFRGPSAEKIVRAPDERGLVVYEDLPGGVWVATATVTRPGSKAVVARDERLVDVDAGGSREVTLDLTRPPRAPATLLVRAHDARSGKAIELERNQVSARRIDDSRTKVTRSEEGPSFETDAGAVEVVVRVAGERIWRPARAVLLLEPGENVVDLELEPCAAIRLRLSGETGGVPPTISASRVSVVVRSQKSTTQFLALRDGRGQLVPGPWFDGRDCWWLVEPGSYDLTTPEVGPEPRDGVRSRTRAVDVAADAIVTFDLAESR